MNAKEQQANQISRVDRAAAILDRALELNGPERDAYMEGACGDDVELRKEVQAMLEAHEEAGDFLAAPTSEKAATIASFPNEKPGTIIDRYKILQLIGEGGFGAVYMAEQQKPVKRRVALKIIKLGMDTKQVIARFEAERQALAMMNHPNIATVLDAGATETGRPYFVMELVKGIPITEYCDQNNLTVQARLDLFKLVCAAVQHAHQKGIIHRDIKPSNVMVTLHDGKPVPKVIDFGIAKAMNRELTDKTLFTEYRQLIGTPQYMSPEQAEMSGLDIDTRSDIYALGVLLYELLTGTTPFDPKRLRSAGLNEIQRIIREEEPHKPSTRLSTLDTLESIAAHRGIEPRKLGLQIRGDLDWIIMKALEKDRTRRYDTAAGFAADVQRHLDDEPVVAGPPSARYRLSKFVRRNRTGVMTACAVLALLLAGIAGTTWGLFREQAAKQAESQQRHVAEAASEKAEQARAEEKIQRDIAEAKTVEARRQSYDARIALAQASIRAGENQTARIRLEQAPAEFRGWEWGFLHAELDRSLVVFRGHEARVNSVAFSPDGSRIASASGRNVLSNPDPTVRLWDAASGLEIRVLRGHEHQVHSVAFSPDGTRIASGSDDKTVRLWDASTGEELVVLRGHAGQVYSVAFSPDGTRIASASDDRTVRLWDASTAEELVVLRGHESRVHSVAFSPEGSRIASGSSDHTVRLWDSASGQELAVLRGHQESVLSVVFSPDGTRIASASNDGTVRLWDTSRAEVVQVLRAAVPGKASYPSSVAFSPDGTRIASGCGGYKWGRRGPSLIDSPADNTIRLWDATSGQELAVLHGHEDGVRSVAFSLDGTRIASGSYDGTVRLWDANSGRNHRVLPQNTPVRSVALSSDGHRSVTFSPDGKRIASALRDGTVRLWDASSLEELAVLRGPESWIHRVAFSPDGSRIATVSLDDGTVRLWDASSLEGLAVIRGHEERVTSVAFSPDGSSIATGSGDKTVRLWDASSGEELLVFRGHEGWVFSVAFSPDGSRIASGSDDKTVRLWDASTGEELTVLRGHEGDIWSVAFSPDGSRIASGSEDMTVRLWDATSGDELLVLRGHAKIVSSVAFSPDGSRIASASHDRTVRLWNVTSGGELVILRGHEDAVMSVAFSPDGSCIASGSGLHDNTVRLWDSVPYRVRIAERDEARRDGETMRPYVDALFEKGLDCSAVAEGVRTDVSLSDPLRHAAINLVLKRCSAIREQAHSLIDDLGKHVVFAADIQAAVQAAVQSDPSLEPAVRAAAVRIALLIEDSPGRLYYWASQVVNDDDRSPNEYEQAQRVAASAFRSKPTSLYFARILAKAWTRLHQPDKAIEVWREHVDQLRAATPANVRRLANALIEYGIALLKNDQAKDAEPVLRECLSIRENRRIAEARRVLGECLTKQARFSEAETILVELAKALLDDYKATESRKTETIQRVVDLYKAWHAAEPDKGYDAKADQWRAKLAEEESANEQDE